MRFYDIRHWPGHYYYIVLLSSLILGFHSESNCVQLADETVTKRLKRQVLNIENIMVHSLDSNVSVPADGRVLVRSSASRIDMSKIGNRLSVGVRANASSLLMDGATASSMPPATAHNFSITADQGAALEIHVADKMLTWTGTADAIELNSARLPSSTGFDDRIDSYLLRNGNTSSALITTLRGQLNGSIDTTLTLREKSAANNATPLSVAIHDGVVLAYWVDVNERNDSMEDGSLTAASVLRIISALTAKAQGQTDVERSLTILAATENDSVRLRMSVINAEITMLYGSTIRVDIASSFRTIVIRRDNLVLELYSPNSTFQLAIDRDIGRRLRVDCSDAKASIILLAEDERENQFWTSVIVQKPLRLELNRYDGALQLLPSSDDSDHAPTNFSQEFERIALIGHEARISLSNTFVDIAANQSAMGLFTNATKAQFAARNQRIRVAGVSTLRLQSGESIISVRRLTTSLADSPASSREALKLDARRPFNETQMRQIG